jgi:hypothetical protein
VEICTPQSRTPIHQFWFYQAVRNTLKMGTGSVPETLEKFRTLIRLCAQENFIEFWITFGKFWNQISLYRRVILAFYCGIFQSYPQMSGYAVAQSAEALRYKPEGRGFYSRWCHRNFSLT